MEDGTEEPPSTSEAAQLVEEAMEQLQAARAALYAADAKVETIRKHTLLSKQACQDHAT